GAHRRPRRHLRGRLLDVPRRHQGRLGGPRRTGPCQGRAEPGRRRGPQAARLLARCGPQADSPGAQAGDQGPRLDRRRRLGPSRAVRVGRQLVDQLRQRLLRRPAVQRRDVACGRRHRSAARAQQGRADQAREDPAAARGLGPVARLLEEAGAALSESGGEVRLLGAADVRRLAAEASVRPTKQRGQNFVIDANTVRRIVDASGVGPQDVVVEIGPGLGSLTLALLERARHVTAVEIDDALAGLLPATITAYAPGAADRFALVHDDAMRVESLPGPEPTALGANLPYNVSVPVLLHFLETFPSLRSVLVMVQAEVAHRLAAGPGSR